MSGLPSPVESSETIVELGRLGSLSDSVFAFALTLLVLEVRIPAETAISDLPANLLALAPKLLIYLIGFVVIGGAWGSHQRILSQIKRGDGILVWYNLLSLLFVTLIPAGTTLLGQFPGAFLAVLCFAIDVILIQMTEQLLWQHASKNGLVNPALDPRIVVSVGRRLTVIAVAFALSVVLALFWTGIVYVVWIGLFIFIFTTDWLSWQQGLETVTSVIALDGAKRGEIDIVHGVGHLNLMDNADEGVLAQGTFGGGLESRLNYEGDLVRSQLEVRHRRGFMSFRYPWAWGKAGLLDWDLGLNPSIPLTLRIETGAGQVDLDFTKTHLSYLSLKSGFSSINLKLPQNAGDTSIYVEARDASVIIEVPQEVALRIYADKAMSYIDADPQRFSPSNEGKEYRSINYDAATNKVEIAFSLSVSTVKII